MTKQTNETLVKELNESEELRDTYRIDEKAFNMTASQISDSPQKCIKGI